MTTGPQTIRRDKNRAKAAPLAKLGMVVFTLGLLAIVADVILFASGSRNLPLWLNLVAMLAPVGLGLGLVGVFLESRRDTRA